ncbi:MAG TPA: Gfo/Idh/MocA family oxidoreductase [Chthonomonadaceae bacterium]|nr:Gfo/Idh/MocA family oxidoreductase [Chthonomonadaceae bacterium]
MSARVRVGVVGTSWYADWMHLPSLKSRPEAEIAALCGRNRERAAALAAKYSIPRIFSNYQEMIGQADLDALVVAAPDDLHYPITMQALEAGLHVLCEKPLALTVAQAGEMARKAEASGVRNMVFFTSRWLPTHRYLKELVAEGFIGRCFHCSIQHFMGYGRSGQYNWRFDSARAHGVLGDLGSHAIDLARWYVGDIARVSAHLTTHVERPGPDGSGQAAASDSVLLALEFVNGAQGIIHVSVVAHVGEREIQQRIELHGEGGTLEAGPALKGMEIRGVRQGEVAFQPLPVPDRLWEGADRSDPFSVFTTQPVGDRYFIEAIRKGQPVAPDFTDGLKVQEVMAAAIESHQNGRWVTL